MTLHNSPRYHTLSCIACEQVIVGVPEATDNNVMYGPASSPSLSSCKQDYWDIENDMNSIVIECYVHHFLDIVNVQMNWK